MNSYEVLLAKPERVTGNIWGLLVKCDPGSHRKKENPRSILTSDHCDDRNLHVPSERG